MASRKKRKFLSSTVRESCNQNQNQAKNDEFFNGYSDITEECLNSVMDVTRRAKRGADICIFTFKSEKLGLASVDIRELSDISYAPCFSSEVCVLSGDISTLCEENHMPRKRCIKSSSVLRKPQQFNKMKVLQHPEDVTALSYANGNMLLSCSLDGSVKVWDSNYQPVQSFMDIMKSPSDIHASSRLDYFVTSSSTGVKCDKGDVLYGASLFSFARRDPVACLLGHTAATQCARFHANGMYVATASRDGTVKMWSTQACARPVRTFRDGDPEEDAHRKTVAFSPDGKYLASTHCGSTKVWDIASGRLVQTLGSAHALRDVCFNHSGSRLATGGTDGVLRIWNVEADSFDADLSESHAVGRPILRIQCAGDIFTCVCSS